MTSTLDDRRDFMREAIRLSTESPQAGGGPFGAVVVSEGAIVGRGQNRVTIDNDPTAHAEILAIRDACRRLQRFALDGCELYSSCEPCPMCLGAILWSRLDVVFFACTRQDAADAGFDDHRFYEELAAPPEQRELSMQGLLRDEAAHVLRGWQQRPDKTAY